MREYILVTLQKECMENKKVIIIAEAGVNHNGDFDLAKKLVDVAADAKVDYVKFQTFKADKIVNKTAEKAKYQSKYVNDADLSQYTMLKKLEMPDDWHHELDKYAKEKNVQFLSTGFDEESIDFLDSSMGLSLFKIPSGEITNKPYLEHIARKKKPIILSTGMATLRDIELAIEVFTENGVSLDMITVLHCNTDYPTPMTDVNLLAMNLIKDKFNVKVGYSDHTLGIEVPIAAVALGACVIEKHFTLDRKMKGPDHIASLEPNELKEMVKSIRNIEMAISGSGMKEPSLSESANMVAARKSIHVSRSLKAGHEIDKTDLLMVRPGDGISPMLIKEVIGKKLKSEIVENHKLKWDDLQS
jgi:N,N'-diacetyllegionaminate synthase